MAICFFGGMVYKKLSPGPGQYLIREKLELLQRTGGGALLLATMYARRPSLHQLGTDSARMRPVPLFDFVSPGARLAFGSPCLSAAVLTLDRRRDRAPERLSKHNLCPRIKYSIMPSFLSRHRPYIQPHTDIPQFNVKQPQGAGGSVVPVLARAAAPHESRLHPLPNPVHPL